MEMFSLIPAPYAGFSEYKVIMLGSIPVGYVRPASGGGFEGFSGSFVEPAESEYKAAVALIVKKSWAEIKPLVMGAA